MWDVQGATLLRGYGFRLPRAAATAFLLGCLASGAAGAQQIDEAAVIRHVDAAAQARYTALQGFTVTEHYAVYRGGDEAHPAAEMTVKTTYRRNSGKSYEVLSRSGSELLQRFVLAPLLEHEKSVNLPGNVEKSWFTSTNYRMTLKPGGIQRVDGRECIGLTLTPLRKAPNMIVGTLWVDAKDNALVEIEGGSSKDPSVLSGPTQMLRTYASLNGFAMAAHGRAESSSFFLGRTVLTIDYRDYQVDLRQAK